MNPFPAKIPLEVNIKWTQTAIILHVPGKQNTHKHIRHNKDNTGNKYNLVPSSLNDALQAGKSEPHKFTTKSQQ